MIKSKILFCAMTTFVLSTQHANAESMYVSIDDLFQNHISYNVSSDITITPSYNILEDVNSGIIVHTETKMYTTTNVNIRTKETKKSKSIKIIKPYTQVVVIDKDNTKEWQQIEYKDKIGYIKSEYLSEKKPSFAMLHSIKLHGLSNRQKQRAYTIAEICIKEWKNYGVLPSVAIAQSMQESTLGKHCSGNNLWGIKSGAVSYSSLESGVYGYLRVINNGYYGTAPFTRNASSQISKILAGGYCTPVGDYYNNVMWIIDHYGLERFDNLVEY